MNGPPNQFEFQYFPTIAVVNLKTGELTRWLEESDLNDADQFGADIIEKVKEANQ